MKIILGLAVWTVVGLGVVIGTAFTVIKLFDLLDEYFDKDIVYSYTGLIKKIKWTQHLSPTVKERYSVVIGTFVMLGFSVLAAHLIVHIINPVVCTISDSLLPGVCERIKEP
jgi:hypothetical protein